MEEYLTDKKELQLTTNNAGNIFYKKWKKDTEMGIFIYAPISLIFYSVCTIAIVGISIKLFFILIWPIVLIIPGLVYTPFFKRKKHINQLAKTIFFKKDAIHIETYDWFTYKSLLFTIKAEDIDLQKIIPESFFKEKNVFLLKNKNQDSPSFFIISEFFDEDVEKSLKEFRVQ